MLWRVQHSFVERYRDHSVNREAIKALVAVYGPREAARQSGLPVGTVLNWCFRYKWKKAERLIRTSGINGVPGRASRDPGDALTEALQSHKEESALNLAVFTAKASRQAAKSKEPLQVARAVRDVAQVYRTVWPLEQGSELVEGAILIGNASVRDDPKEILDAAVFEPAKEDVREGFSDQGPESD